MIEEGSIDRLVVTDDEAGRPIRARVIDFKTDQVEANAVATAAQAYEAQLVTYRAAAAEFLGIGVDALETELVFVVPGVVVRGGGPPDD